MLSVRDRLVLGCTNPADFSISSASLFCFPYESESTESGFFGDVLNAFLFPSAVRPFLDADSARDGFWPGLADPDGPDGGTALLPAGFQADAASADGGGDPDAIHDMSPPVVRAPLFPDPLEKVV